ncbi:hypothetical protein AAMO2058_001422400 [Amorphochlora amoebiformis]
MAPNPCWGQKSFRPRLRAVAMALSFAVVIHVLLMSGWSNLSSTRSLKPSRVRLVWQGLGRRIPVGAKSRPGGVSRRNFGAGGAFGVLLWGLRPRESKALNLFGSTVTVSKMTPVEQSEAISLIQDVYETMDKSYIDAYAKGYSSETWKAAAEAAQGKTYQYREQVYEEIRKMLAGCKVDDYTTFLEPEEIVALTKYDVSGIGINLVTKEEFKRKVGPVSDSLDEDSLDGDVFILAVLKESPAAALGLHLGDQIVSVDGQNVRGAPPFDVLQRIQGKSASDESVPNTVTISFKRAQNGEEQTIEIPRPGGPGDSPVTTQIESRPGGIRRGIITLSEFNSKAAREVEDAVRQLDSSVDEYVLDLRYNLGGIAQEAVQIAGMFMGGGRPVTYTVSNTGELLEGLDLTRGPLTTKPLLVRVNFLTASASEILAGALQDNCRAVLVGTRTFGKGVIQGIYQFSDGSGMKLTIGKYLTPKRRDINNKGIQPDFFLMPSSEKAAKKLKTCQVPSDS